MPASGNFRDLLDLLDRVSERASVEPRLVRPTPCTPELRELAEQRWIVSGILRLAFSAEEREP